MYISGNFSKKVTTEAEIDAMLDELRRVVQGTLLVDTFDFQLTVSFSATDDNERYDETIDDTIW